LDEREPAGIRGADHVSLEQQPVAELRRELLEPPHGRPVESIAHDEGRRGLPLRRLAFVAAAA
jgi:hypothetical protein